MKTARIVLVCALVLLAAPPALASPPRQLDPPGKCGQYLIDEYGFEQTDNATYVLNFSADDLDLYPDDLRYEVAGWTALHHGPGFRAGAWNGYGDGWLRAQAPAANDTVAVGVRFSFGYDDCMVTAAHARTRLDNLADTIAVAVKNDPDDDTSDFYDQAVDSWNTGFGHSYEWNGWDYDPAENLASIWLAVKGTSWYQGGWDYVQISFDSDEPAPPPDEDDYINYYRPFTRDDELDVNPGIDWAGLDHLVIDNTAVEPWADEAHGENYPMDDSADELNMNPYNLLYRSIAAGAPVHSAGYASVVSITDVDETLCADYETYEPGETDITQAIIDAVTFDWGDLYRDLVGAGDEVTVCHIDIEDYFALTPNYIFSGGFFLPIPGLIENKISVPLVGQIVKLHMLETGQYVLYWVMDAHSYVIEDQIVSSGCVIGESLPGWYVAHGALVDYMVVMDAGYLFVWGQVESSGYWWPQDLRHRMWIHPSLDEPCSLPDFGSCVNGNPSIVNPISPWFMDRMDAFPHGGPGISFYPEDTGVYLEGDGFNDMQQTIVLPNPAWQYAVKISAYVHEPNSGSTDSVIDVSIGDTTYNITVPKTGEPIEFVSPLATVSDSDYSGNMADFRLAYDDPNLDGVVHVTYACIDDSADPISDLPVCVLPNFGFDDDSEWNLTDAPPNYPYIQNGALELSLYTAADQPLDLMPDLYTLTIRYRCLPLMVPPLGGYSCQVDWYYEDSTPVVVDSGFFAGLSDDWIEDSAEVDITTLVTGGTFTINANSTTDAIQVDYVCLTPSNRPPDSATACNSCPATYVGDAIRDSIESVEWLACRIDALYWCDWRDFVERTTEATETTVIGIGMFARWLEAVISKGNTFLLSGFRYLGGHLNNVGLAVADSVAWMVGGSTTIIQDQSLGFWDVIGLLINGLRDVLLTAMNSLVELVSMLFEFLGPIAGTLLNVVETVLNMISGIMDAVIEQINVIYQIVAAILTAINDADPQSIPGAPDCSNFGSGQDESWFCWGFYVIDNTLLSGPVQYLIPIMIGALSFNLLLWGFGQLREAIGNL